MQTPHPWSDLHGHRWDWARSALSDFRATAPETIRPLLREGDLVTKVVLYGLTQMGKTTLVLTLMGVTEGPLLERLGTALRGGRRSGQSATLLPTRYHAVAAEGGWTLRVGDVERFGLPDDEFADALAQLRHDVVRGQSAALRLGVIEVGVPVLKETAEAVSHVHILDLPGEAAIDSAEGAVVRELADYYVPRSDVVILVARADDPTSIRPTALGHIPALAYWPEQPARYRIVLTYSVSMKSERDWIQRQTQQITPESWRGHITDMVLGAILAHRRSDPASSSDATDELHSVFYPIEIGQSWATLAHEDPVVFERMEPVIRQLLDELSASTNGRDLDEASLVASLRWPQEVGRAVVLERARRSDRLEAARAQVTTDTRALKQVESRIRERSAIASSIQRQIEILDELTERKNALHVPQPRAAKKAPDEAKDAIDNAMAAGLALAHNGVVAWEAWARFGSIDPGPGVTDYVSQSLTHRPELESDLQQLARTEIACCKQAANMWGFRDGCSAERCHRRLQGKGEDAVEAVEKLLKRRMARALSRARKEAEQGLLTAESDAAALLPSRRHLAARLTKSRAALQALEAHARQLFGDEDGFLAEAKMLTPKLATSWTARQQELGDRNRSEPDQLVRALIQLSILQHHLSWERIMS